MNKTIRDVEQFWDNNPLWTGESNFEVGSEAFFKEHRKIVIDDCFAGKLDERVIPKISRRHNVLDLGCGIGMWVVEIGQYCDKITGVDLTDSALTLAKKRVSFYNLNNYEISKQNAESLTFKDEGFSHVNCLGVIHHTPDTQACVREIHRVLETNGTATIAVYYKNIILRNWKIFRGISKLLGKAGAKLKGRGRSSIYLQKDIDEIVRLYDGKENPIGKAYDKKEFKALLEPYFTIDEMYLHFFPRRSLPFYLPRPLHKILDRTLGFMVYANVVKK